jgi:hypothetical protein
LTLVRADGIQSYLYFHIYTGLVALLDRIQLSFSIITISTNRTDPENPNSQQAPTGSHSRDPNIQDPSEDHHDPPPTPLLLINSASSNLTTNPLLLDCAICTEPIPPEKRARILIYNHSDFHYACLEMWIFLPQDQGVQYNPNNNVPPPLSYPPFPPPAEERYRERTPAPSAAPL